MLFSRFFFYICIYFLQTFAFAYPPLTRDEFNTIDNISRDVYDDCPKENCLIIGLGRSPTAIIANLQANYPDAEAINVPLSNLKTTDLDAKKEIILFDHFDEFIKPHLQNKNKVIVIDFTLEGKGFFAGFFYVNKYLEKFFEASPFTIVAYAFASLSNIEKIGNLFTATKIKLKTYPLRTNADFLISLNDQAYDGISEFGSFFIKHDDVKKKEKLSSEKYIAFKELMKEMSRLGFAYKEEILKEFANKNNEIRDAAIKLWSDLFDFDDPVDMKHLNDLFEQLITLPKVAITANFRTAILGAIISIFKKKSGKTSDFYDTFFTAAISNINDADEWVRRSVKIALNLIDINDRPMFKIAIKILRDQPKTYRDAAVAVLDDTFSTRRDVNKALRVLELKDDDYAAFKSLIGDRLISQEQDVRETAISSLRDLKITRSDDTEFHDKINNLIFDKIINTDDRTIKSYLIDALGQTRPHALAIKSFLLDEIKSDDENIRSSSVEALKKISPHDPEILQRLNNMLESTDAKIRSSVVDILNEITWRQGDNNIFERLVLTAASLLNNNSESKPTILNALKFIETNISIKPLNIDPSVYEYIANKFLSDDPDILMAVGKAFAEIKIEDVPQKDYLLPLLFPVLEKGKMAAVKRAVQIFETFKKLYDFKGIKIDDAILEQMNKLYDDRYEIQNKIRYVIEIFNKKNI